MTASALVTSERLPQIKGFNGFSSGEQYVKTFPQNVFPCATFQILIVTLPKQKLYHFRRYQNIGIKN